MQRILLICLATLLAGCSTSSVSTVSRVSGLIVAGKIGMAANAGELSDAIAIDLSAQGFDVAGPTIVRQIDNLAALNQAGIKTLLIVKSIQAFDGYPSTATVQIVSTTDGQMIAAINWKNGYSGRAGSIDDRIMRSDTEDAAKDIVNEISKKLSK